MGGIGLIRILVLGLCFFLTGIPFVSIDAFAEDNPPDKIPFSISNSKGRPEKGKKEERSPWIGMETRYTLIRYEKLDDLKKFDGKVNFLPSDFSLKSLFSETAPQELEGKVRRKIDALYERVQEILDMRKRTEKKVVIELHPNKKSLKQAYHRLFGGELNVRALYVYEINTIFINIDDIHEGMLAHELAHAIIDNYLTTRPPRAAAEILAIYVHTHLFKKTKSYDPFE